MSYKAFAETSADAYAQPSPACLSDAKVCASELASIRRAAHEVWGARGDRHPALTNYRICQDFKSCYTKDCSRTPSPGLSYDKFKAASRPFIMFNHSGKPAIGTVVLVHGLSDSPYSFGTVAEDLSRRGYNVVTVLLSGHGADHRNPAKPTAEDWRQDLANGVQLAKTVFHNQPLSVGGYSTGGALCVDYLQRHPQEQNTITNLLLFDPALALPPMNESGLKGRGFIGTALHAVGMGAQQLSSYAQENNPAHFPLIGIKDAPPLMNIIDSIRTTDRSISTPTLAIFSTGLNEAKNFSAIDTIRSRIELFGNGHGVAGKLASDRQLLNYGEGSTDGHKPLRHSEIMLREDLGNCGVEKNAINPYFKEMMQTTAEFLDKHNSGMKPVLAGVEDGARR